MGASQEEGTSGHAFASILERAGNEPMLLPDLVNRLLRERILKKTTRMLLSRAGESADPIATADRELIAGEGPWFQGWYTRITMEGGNGSIAVVGGTQYLPGMTMPTKAFLPGYLAVIISDNGQTRIYEAFPEQTTFWSNRDQVLDDPQSPYWEEFLWEAKENGTISNERIDISIPGSVEVEATLGARLPWNHSVTWLGPEGLVEFLTFVPLHWFVTSLGSESTFTFVEKNGTPVSGRGFAHQESNWGTLFPLAWVWAEGISPDNTRQFALSGGQLMLGDTLLTTWLVGYHSPIIQWQFRPTIPQTEYITSIDACAGSFSIVAKDSLRKLVITAEAPAYSFVDVSVSTEKGFQPVAGVSFSADVTVKGYLKFPWFGYVLVDRSFFSNAALEFGAGYKCEK